MWELVFNAPWWLPAVLVVAGLVLLIAGSRRIDKTLKLAGLAAIGLAILVLLLSWAVQTDINRAEKQTRQLIATVDSRDWTTMKSLLSDVVSCRISENCAYRNSQELVKATEMAVNSVGVRSVRLSAMESSRAGGVISVSITVAASVEATGDTAFPTNWRLDWQRVGDRLLLMQIHLLPDPLGMIDKVRQRAPTLPK